MKKFRLIFDKNTEIPWLNEMAEQGWNLKKFGCGFYEFEPCQPGEYVYETDLKDNLTSVSKEYQSILESQGIELIPCFGFWFIVRRKKSGGPLELYTDSESRLEQYRRIRRMFQIVSLIELFLALMEAWGFSETGSWVLLLFTGLLAVLGLVLMNEVRKLNIEIAEMENRADEQSPNLVCAFGFFMMAAGYLIRERVDRPVFVVLMVAAIAVVLYGVYKKRTVVKQNG